MVWQTKMATAKSEIELMLIPAVLLLNSGTRLRGLLYNLDFVELPLFIKFRNEKGETHQISRTAVNAVFVGDHSSKDRRLCQGRFIDDAQSFRLGGLIGEVFPPAKSYCSGDFCLFPSKKLDSNTRWVIARKSLLQPISS